MTPKGELGGVWGTSRVRVGVEGAWRSGGKREWGKSGREEWGEWARKGVGREKEGGKETGSGRKEERDMGRERVWERDWGEWWREGNKKREGVKRIGESGKGEREGGEIEKEE
ncbi:uncharacterized protein LOC134235601 [Saccostrea cucullata]|uniref:uncharacterized protein LOC134235601 n=1 Tax=Saccostrea cuccullata TaxID=36930 RepID=UPI002ED0EB62